MPHELSTVEFLADLGRSIEVIPPSKHKAKKTADIKMVGLEWEMKAPTSNGKYTIEHRFRAALKQSPNIIFDIRASKMPEQKCVKEITKRFHFYKKVNRVLIICKTGNIIDLCK